MSWSYANIMLGELPCWLLEHSFTKFVRATQYSVHNRLVSVGSDKIESSITKYKCDAEIILVFKF